MLCRIPYTGLLVLVFLGMTNVCCGYSLQSHLRGDSRIFISYFIVSFKFDWFCVSLKPSVKETHIMEIQPKAISLASRIISSEK